MTITTKYNIGDTVWFMEDNRASFGSVINIEALRQNKVDYVCNEIKRDVYGVKPSDRDAVFQMSESYVFPSKQELLASL